MRDLRANRVVGWSSFVVGITVGLVMGLWSFGGPLPSPEVLGQYDDLSRRLARLGHIAFFGLGILNVLLARELPRLTLKPGLCRVASTTMNFGNIFLPLTLLAAAAFHPIKYLMSIPATAVLVALVILAWGVIREQPTPNETDSQSATHHGEQVRR
jgi:hypothetical protein